MDFSGIARGVSVKLSWNFARGIFVHAVSHEFTFQFNQVMILTTSGSTSALMINPNASAILTQGNCYRAFTT
jgi:hypothetical protein